jgi:hypothetical protein
MNEEKRYYTEGKLFGIKWISRMSPKSNKLLKGYIIVWLSGVIMFSVLHILEALYL